jgi:hypothetical protein
MPGVRTISIVMTMITTTMIIAMATRTNTASIPDIPERR